MENRKFALIKFSMVYLITNIFPRISPHKIESFGPKRRHKSKFCERKILTILQKNWVVVFSDDFLKNVIRGSNTFLRIYFPVFFYIHSPIQQTFVTVTCSYHLFAPKTNIFLNPWISLYTTRIVAILAPRFFVVNPIRYWRILHHLRWGGGFLPQ